MTSEIKNMAASVRGRLANVAKAEQRPFDSILLLYMQERLLFRLSVSEYVNHFVLKGGLLMFMLTDYKGRPTKDIDFLADQVSNDLERIRRAFQEICIVDCKDDGLVFNSESVEVEIIKEDAEYEGVRVKIICSLGKAKKSLQLDIGFGDVVVPKPAFMACPTLLDLDAPNIKVYSLESIISEKFQAMIVLSVVNSRMKDFYDIYTLLNANGFEGKQLYQAIFETLNRRNTALEREPVIFTRSFSQDSNRNMMWKAFLKKINVAEIPFEAVMSDLNLFIGPIYDAILNNEEFLMRWDHVEKKWSI